MATKPKKAKAESVKPAVSYSEPAPPPAAGSNAEQLAQALESQPVESGPAAQPTPPHGLELDLINKVARLTQELDQVRAALGIPADVSTLDGVNRLREKLATARRRARGGPLYF
jgi:hypothetical protein